MAKEGRSQFYDLGPGPIPFLDASVFPQMPLMEAACCLGDFLGPEVSGDEAMQHPHSHHLGCWGSQKQLRARVLSELEG